jgi:hypothetical protein
MNLVKILHKIVKWITRKIISIGLSGPLNALKADFINKGEDISALLYRAQKSRIKIKRYV